MFCKFTFNKNNHEKIENYESYSLLITNRNFFLIGDITLYNSKELIKNNNLRKNLSNNDIIINLYLKYGSDFIKLLYGEYSFILYDVSKDYLLFVKDLTSRSMIYYYKTSQYIVFSSSLKKIVESTKFKLNIKRYFQITSIFTLYQNETYFKNVYFLRKKEYGIINNNNFEMKNYYSVPKKKIYYKNKVEYYEHFEELIQESLRNRLENYNKVGIMLSGGLDSTTIAHEFSNLYKNKILYSYTHIPQYKTIHAKKTTDESNLVIDFLKTHPNIKGTFINSKNRDIITPLFESLEIHPEPPTTSNNLYWLFDIINHSKKDNIEALIIAQKGNLTISWPSLLFYNLFYKKDYKNIKTTLITLGKKIFIYDKYYQLKKRNELINFIKKDAILTSVSKDLYITQIKNYPINYQLKRSLREQWLFSNKITPFIEQKKPKIIDPSSDIKLIEFLFNIPDELYNTPFDKKFLNKYLQGRIPNSIINNKKKGYQSSDIDIRIAKAQKHIRDIVITKLKDLDLIKKYYNLNNKNISKINLKELQKMLFLYKLN